MKKRPGTIWIIAGIVLLLSVLFMSFGGFHGGSESAVTGTETSTSPDTVDQTTPAAPPGPARAP